MEFRKPPIGPDPDAAPDSGLAETRSAAGSTGAALARDPSYLPTEEQVNHRATVGQRQDRIGSKVEEIAGTGDHDSKGG
jgi:hypothetical protein